MPQYPIKLCTYDPAIIDAFDRLRKNRKQAAFTHEALKNFISTEKGNQVLLLMEGKTSKSPSISSHLLVDIPKSYTTAEPQRVQSNSTTMSHDDSNSVLDSILR